MFNGRKLKELRITAGLTQQELGDLVNVTKVSICCYEKGNRTPNIETLMDLTEVLSTTPNYLLDAEVTAKVSEEEETYEVSLSKTDVEIIKELKKHNKLYEQFCENPKRIIEKLDKKLN